MLGTTHYNASDAVIKAVKALNEAILDAVGVNIECYLEILDVLDSDGEVNYQQIHAAPRIYISDFKQTHKVAKIKGTTSDGE